MDMALIELREAQVEAHAAFQAARDAIKEADETADLDKLEASFTAAEEQYNTARKDFAQGEERQRLARQKFALDEKALEADRLLSAAGEPARASVTQEPLTYRRNSEHGFFRDLYRRDMSHDSAAAERLERHGREMLVERQAKFDLSSTDAAGGYLVAPLWLNDQFVDIATAGRVVTNTIGTRPLPPNADSINLPTLSTGTSVATQADNAAVSETDAVFSTISADVKTVAGLQDVSQQLVDRGVPGVDEVIFADLAKRYALNIDTAVINSSTSNNLGLLQVSGTNSVTYTDASPTVPELYSKLASAIQQVHTGVFQPANAIFMHPRRWAWVLASLDGNNRPLVNQYQPMNAAGATAGVVAEGLVGSIQGVNVYVDANIPTTLGASTTEDRIIVCRTDELYVYEEPSGPFLETFRDIGSGTLTVRFRMHNYWAQINARRPTAISVVSGTGLIAPTF